MREDAKLRYAALWDTCEILPTWRARVNKAVDHLLLNCWRYERVARAVGVPWEAVGLLHLMEASGNFQRQLLNGERWDRVTTLVPVGYGPWKSWEESAIDALEHTDGCGDGGDIDMLSFLESWNGWGYRNKGKQSPYLWSGSQHGVGLGKYTSDGRYNPAAVSKQVGAAVALKRLRQYQKEQEA